MPSFDVSARFPALLYSSSISAVVLGLMLFMAVRLYAGNRRRAYRSLVISLGFIFVHHLLQLSLSLGWLPGATGFGFAGKVIQVFAFIVMNFAVFELYYRRRPRTRLWFYSLFALAAVVAAGYLMQGPGTDGGSGWAERLARTPILDGYLLVLSPLFALMFGPHIGQRRKYGAGLAAAFVAQFLVIVDRYGSPDSSVYLMLAELFQVVYYILLFMILFERVVELLMSAYRSSITDGLTNLYNRRYFVSQLERALRKEKPVGVIFCDIDNFKRLNDSHGHHRADGVLKQAASIIAEETEGTGMAGRYGGEELVAFLAGPELTTIQTAETIRSRIEKESLVTVSVGVCVAAPGSGLTADELLHKADQAMYHSKSSGKNRVTDFASMPETDNVPLILKR